MHELGTRGTSLSSSLAKRRRVVRVTLDIGKLSGVETQGEVGFCNPGALFRRASLDRLAGGFFKTAMTAPRRIGSGRCFTSSAR